MRWKEFGLEDINERLNIVFMILMFIWNQYLKEETCTIDQIAANCEEITKTKMGKNYSIYECKQLCGFIIDTILKNDGQPMKIHAFNFEQDKYNEYGISYVGTKYDAETKKVSYYPTEKCQTLILSSYEMEQNMRINIDNLVFELRLEKQEYDKALESVKRLVQEIQKQTKKIEDSMDEIKENAYSFSPERYEELRNENLDILESTGMKFKAHKKKVEKLIQDLDQKNINIHEISKEDKENVENLREINKYLSRVIDSQLKIQQKNEELQIVYRTSCADMIGRGRINRFSFSEGVFDKIQKNPEALERIDEYLSPLFYKRPNSIFNLYKVFESQTTKTISDEEANVERYEFDYDTEQKKLNNTQIRQEKSNKIIEVILEEIMKNGETSLFELNRIIEKDERIRNIILCDINIFKTVISKLQGVTSKKISEDNSKKNNGGFSIQKAVKTAMAKHPEWEQIKAIAVRNYENERVIFVFDEKTKVECTNIKIEITKGGR